MRIRADTRKMGASGMELLRLSRESRRKGEELEKIQRKLRGMKEFDECIAAIQKQNDALSDIASELAMLSGSMDEIVRLYDLTEAKNAERAEEQAYRSRNRMDSLQFCTTEKMQKRLAKLLNLSY